MWCWYYDKRELRHTQSIQQGLTVEQEIQYRREGARFILQIGNKMGLRYETMATGVVYYHRFYMVHTFQEFSRHVTACCCLFLAGKVEETPKKCKDIMKTAKSLIDDETWAEFGTDPREEVMTLERILLQTIKFDFIVEHPYPYLLKYAKCLKGDKKKLHNMVQMAWTFVNDSLCTTLSLQWEPEIIAIALMYLAGKLSKFEVTDWNGRTSKHQRWWDIYVQGISMDLLEDICHQVLDLYSPKSADGGGNVGGSSTTAGSINMALFTGDAQGAVSVPGTRPRPTDAVTTPTGGPPPAKKAKKEEVAASPAKVPEVVSTVSAVPTAGSQATNTSSSSSYSYPYSSYPNYPPGPHNYPPPPSSAPPPASTTGPPARYPPAPHPTYNYPPNSSTQVPPPQGPPQGPPPQQVPPNYQQPSGPPARQAYVVPPPPTGGSSSGGGPPPQYNRGQGPPPSASHQYPPSGHSSGPGYHQAPGSGSHYPPSHPPAPTNQAPPPAHYPPPPSHGSSSSSYYPPPPNGAQGQPPGPYQQTDSRSSYPSSYGGHTGHSGHSTSRPYYPPS